MFLDAQAHIVMKELDVKIFSSKLVYSSALGYIVNWLTKFMTLKYKYFSDFLQIISRGQVCRLSEEVKYFPIQLSLTCMNCPKPYSGQQE